jgi:hypothetical protein
MRDSARRLTRLSGNVRFCKRALTISIAPAFAHAGFGEASSFALAGFGEAVPRLEILNPTRLCFRRPDSGGCE